MYYGLALNAGTLAGDIYLNTFLMGAVEIPANIIALVLLSKAGRRYGVGGGLLVGGVALVISIPFILQPGKPIYFYEHFVWKITVFPSEKCNMLVLLETKQGLDM